ncbi:sensor histidine kinase N-terminal domain-containing protein [Massilia oculi]|uniref:histidine kinase n=1 Tax=Massilia hydrophila TaxID=3044279 RepID=A0ABS7YBD4_9BURK|nr:ATP-binding protein [Massilia oculi]MCA1857013.1 sensor histidine kinase N-terminal domain-containing protein [Massilia oculi]
MPSAAWSLRRRLLAAILGASAVLWLASLGTLTAIAWQETGEVFDDALEESAYMLLAAGGELDARGLLAPLPPPAQDRVRRVDMQYQLVEAGRVVQRSADAPARPFVAGFGDDHGFADLRLDGERWRVFVVRDAARGFEVQVGQRAAKRLDILEELAEALWLPVLGFLLLLALVCWWLTGRVLAPLRRTAAALAAQTPDDLAPVATDGQPRELLPIVGALNGVLARLDAALQAERRFTADAAHELRTPLAGLHMHVQLLQRQHPALAASFGRLRQDVGRLAALVDSLLTLARLDPLARAQLASGELALAPLFAELAAEFADEAARRGIVLDAALAPQGTPATVRGDAQMLGIALRNLVGNALRYCPAGSRVELRAGTRAGKAWISVCDDGPGVDAASMARLTERFFRVLGQEEGGSGLGLSIVRRIAELHGIALRFGPGLGGRGLGVTLDWQGAP